MVFVLCMCKLHPDICLWQGTCVLSLCMQTYILFVVVIIVVVVVVCVCTCARVCFVLFVVCTCSHIAS